MSMTDRDIPAVAWPTLTEAAAMVGVHVSTMSRDPSLITVEAGRRDKRVRPLEVLRLAEHHQKRVLNEVAQELIDYAAEKSPDFAEAVEEEVELFFEERLTPAATPAEPFLDQLEKILPDDVFQRVRMLYRASRNHTPGDLIASEATLEAVAVDDAALERRDHVSN